MKIKPCIQVKSIIEAAARQFCNVDDIVEFQRRLHTFVKTQCLCIKLLREEITENKNRVTHIKSLLDPINSKEDTDFMFEPSPSDPIIQSARVNIETLKTLNKH